MPSCNLRNHVYAGLWAAESVSLSLSVIRVSSLQRPDGERAEPPCRHLPTHEGTNLSAAPRKGPTPMNENSTLDEATLARQALQESMDLRDQGHSDD